MKGKRRTSLATAPPLPHSLTPERRAGCAPAALPARCTARTACARLAGGARVSSVNVLGCRERERTDEVALRPTGSLLQRLLRDLQLHAARKRQRARERRRIDFRLCNSYGTTVGGSAPLLRVKHEGVRHSVVVHHVLVCVRTQPCSEQVRTQDACKTRSGGAQRTLSPVAVLHLLHGAAAARARAAQAERAAAHCWRCDLLELRRPWSTLGRTRGGARRQRASQMHGERHGTGRPGAALGCRLSFFFDSWLRQEGALDDR